jgi:hypothetical protein
MEKRMSWAFYVVPLAFIGWFCARTWCENRFGARRTALTELVVLIAYGLNMCAMMINDEITGRSSLIHTFDATMAAVQSGKTGLAAALGLRDQLGEHRTDLLIDGPLLMLVGLVLGVRIHRYWEKYGGGKRAQTPAGLAPQP